MSSRSDAGYPVVDYSRTVDGCALHVGYRSSDDQRVVSAALWQVEVAVGDACPEATVFVAYGQDAAVMMVRVPADGEGSSVGHGRRVSAACVAACDAMQRAFVRCTQGEAAS